MKLQSALLCAVAGLVVVLAQSAAAEFAGLPDGYPDAADLYFAAQLDYSVNY